MNADTREAIIKARELLGRAAAQIRSYAPPYARLEKGTPVSGLLIELDACASRLANILRPPVRFSWTRMPGGIHKSAIYRASVGRFDYEVRLEDLGGKGTLWAARIRGGSESSLGAFPQMEEAKQACVDHGVTIAKRGQGAQP